MKKIVLSLCLLILFPVGGAFANPSYWKLEWPKTDFSKHNVSFDEIFSGGPPKDGIPPIDDPVFESLEEGAKRYAALEPVVGLVVNGKAKAYPLSVLIWHEIVNDEIGGVPVSVTYCPLCNSAIVFDRRVDGRVLDVMAAHPERIAPHLHMPMQSGDDAVLRRTGCL